MGSTVHLYTSKTHELQSWFCMILTSLKFMLTEGIQVLVIVVYQGNNTEVMSAKSRCLAAGKSMDREQPHAEGHHRTMTLF